jgi:hypothetical protein
VDNAANRPFRFSSTDALNYLNIGLMLISFAAAYILPFQVFLFSYAVLGPLHYLTEISWLEKRNYFVKSKQDVWIFVLLVLLVTMGRLGLGIKGLTGSLVFSAFVYALAILFVKKTNNKLLFVLLAFAGSLLFHFNRAGGYSYILFAVLLPTIIHVFIFTGAFILLGALRSRSLSGILSLFVFIFCAIAFFVYTPDNFNATLSEYYKNAYSYFTSINVSLYHLFGFGTIRSTDAALYINPNAVAIMRFIAFAYTYHYLNWFSKTTIIKWNQISPKRMTLIIVVWIFSIGLYAFNVVVGFYVLFLLSLLHVLLEFPLNHQTFIGIGKELKSMIRPINKFP